MKDMGEKNKQTIQDFQRELNETKTDKKFMPGNNNIKTKFYQ